MHKILIAIIFSMLSVSAFANGKCYGRFINPITHVDWKAIFPLHIAGVKVASSHNDKATKSPPKDAICVCKDRMPFVYGVPVAFWQPWRAVDVTRKPYCMVNLGGMQLSTGLSAPTGDIANNTAKGLGRGQQSSFYHVHWYMYPLLSWMNLLTDIACMEHEEFDIAYMTELDPMWSDDELSMWISPESLLFGNPVAQLACVTDCVSANAATPIDSLFWCAGCQGGVYPLSGTISGHQSAMDSTTLELERMLFKLHREGLIHSATGVHGMCTKFPQLWWKKSEFKTQVVYPSINKIREFSTNVIGKTVLPWSIAKDVNLFDGDFGYLLWRRKECCVL